uniref:Ig-like domain-containing protein n=1 Tax=Oncorhynchus mykiss TaxID=8022 RepID=A0A8K9UXM5_ONCMY
MMCDCIAVKLAHNGWSVSYTRKQICILKGSSYRIPGNKENDCTLRFTGLRMSDSAEYRFRLRTILGGKFAGTPVLLTVTDVLLELDPTSVSEGESAILRCRTKCTLGPNTAFIWYKNGQPIPNNYPYSNRLYQNPVSNDDAGSYSCAVDGHDDLHSPEVTLRVRYKPKSTSASVSPSGKIVEGSSVTLTCNSDANPPVQNYTWLKRNVTSPKASGPSYTITKISSEDNGEYYCEARNILGGENSRELFIWLLSEINYHTIYTYFILKGFVITVVECKLHVVVNKAMFLNE